MRAFYLFHVMDLHVKCCSRCEELYNLYVHTVREERIGISVDVLWSKKKKIIKCHTQS